MKKTIKPTQSVSGRGHSRKRKTNLRARARRGGMPAFVPTDNQRRFVAAMAGIRMKWDEIQLLIVNERTKRPIGRATLAKAFKHELAAGAAKLDSVITTRFYDALARGEPWAVQMGLRNRFGWDGAKHANVGVAINTGGTEQGADGMLVRFVLPEPQPEPQPDYSLKALPPPREVPFAERRDYPDRPSGPRSWME
jgi:hypothetical protein